MFRFLPIQRLVKTRMQLQSDGSRLYRNSFHCFQLVLRNEGIRGLYKGTSASYLGISESTIQFVVYEWLKKLYRDRRRSDGSPANSLTYQGVSPKLFPQLSLTTILTITAITANIS